LNSQPKAPTARIVHQTRARLRLRITEKRRDLPFFLGLYEHLREAPGVAEVTMNPLTGTVLLRFDERRRHTLFGALADSSLIRVEPGSAIGVRDGRGGPAGGRVSRFVASAGGGAADARAIVFIVMAGLSARQILRGHLLAPAVTLTLFGLEFAIRSMRERGHRGGQGT
jgi:hypothetical protein